MEIILNKLRSRQIAVEQIETFQRQKVAAYDGPQYQVTQQVMNRFAEAVQQSRVDVVPRVVVGGSQGQGGASVSSIMEGLLILLLSDKLNLDVSSTSPRQASEEVERLWQEIRQSMAKKPAIDTDSAKK